MDFSRLSQTDLSKALGIPSRTIRSWPDTPRNEDKSYNLPRVIAWLIAKAEDDSPAAAEDPESRQWLNLYRKERYFLARLDRQEREGSLIPRAEIGAQWAARIAEVGAGLYNLASRLPPLLEGKTQPEMGPIIKGEVRKLHESYCRTGRFCIREDHNENKASDSQ